MSVLTKFQQEEEKKNSSLLLDLHLFTHPLFLFAKAVRSVG